MVVENFLLVEKCGQVCYLVFCCFKFWLIEFKILVVMMNNGLENCLMMVIGVLFGG